MYSLLPSQCLLADAGLPMLLVVWPLLIFLLVPIICIESLFFKTLQGLSWKQAFLAAFKANFYSTLVGIPLTWLVLLLGTFIVHRLGWCDMIYEDNSWPVWLLITGATVGSFFWKMTTACLALFIPFFLVSVWFEGIIYKKHFKASYSAELIQKTTWKANIGSYGFLVLIISACMVYFFLRY